MSPTRSGGGNACSNCTFYFIRAPPAQQFPTVDIPNNAHPVPVPAFHIADVHTHHWLQGVNGVDARLHDHVQKGIDITIGVLDAVSPLLLDGLNHPSQAEQDELFKVSGRHQWSRFPSVVVA